MPGQVRQGLIPGALSALLYVLLPLTGGIGFIPGLISPMPVIYATLAGGQISGLAAAGIGFVFAVVAIDPNIGVGYLISAGLPGLAAGLVLTRQRVDGAGQTVHPGIDRLVLAGLLYALACLVGAFVYLSGGAGIETTLRDLFDQTLANLPPEFGAGVRVEMLDLMVGMTPGAPLAVLGAVLVLNGLWAVRVADKRGKLSRPPLDFASLRMPDWAFAAFAIAFLISQVTDGDLSFMAGQASIVLAMPFCLAGFSVVHALTAGKSWRGIALGFAYGLLIIGVWPGIMMVVGLVDHLFGLKARFGAQRSGKNEE